MKNFFIKMMKIVFICMFLLSLNNVNCKIPAVINGTVTGSDEALFYVALVTNIGQVFCGGTLISKNKVLTAAHCVRFPPAGNPENVFIMYGMKKYRGGKFKPIRALKIVKHPEYRPIDPQRQLLGKNDLAVITLSEDIEENSSTKYAQLQNKQIPPQESVTAYGLGRNNTLNFQQRTFPDELMKAKLVLILIGLILNKI